MLYLDFFSDPTDDVRTVVYSLTLLHLDCLSDPTEESAVDDAVSTECEEGALSATDERRVDLFGVGSCDVSSCDVWPCDVWLAGGSFAALLGALSYAIR